MKIEEDEMECEICGRTVVKRFPVEIEGSVMRVCGSCARFGKRVKERKTIAHTSTRHPPSRTRRSTAGRDFVESELLDQYQSMIRAARERMGMTQEQLGKLISERESVINRIEGGKMKPDAKLIHKLERTLGVKITGKMEIEKIPAKRPVKRELTLGDVVKIKKKQE
ncbi:MAG: multiprotein bridging factor aMBF1 [Candidatus Hydrothermarchaeaceae archaeon]